MRINEFRRRLNGFRRQDNAGGLIRLIRRLSDSRRDDELNILIGLMELRERQFWRRDRRFRNVHWRNFLLHLDVGYAPDTFDKAVRIYEHFEEASLRLYGLEVLAAVLRYAPGAHEARALNDLDEWMRRNGGRRPSQVTAIRICQNISGIGVRVIPGPLGPVPRNPFRDRYYAARAELNRVRQNLRLCRQENTRLRRENLRLRQQLRQARG